jgi:hypothetical protein
MASPCNNEEILFQNEPLKFISILKRENLSTVLQSHLSVTFA